MRGEDKSRMTPRFEGQATRWIMVLLTEMGNLRDSQLGGRESSSALICYVVISCMIKCYPRANL